MRFLILPLLTLSLTLTQYSNAQSTLLIGPGVRNGDFNDDIDPTDERSFEVTPFWENINGSQTLVATRTNLDSPSGTRNAQLSHAATQLTAQSTGHILAEGDSFNVSYVWRDGFNWNDAIDKVRVTLFVTDDETITGSRTSIASTDSNLSTFNNSWEPVETNNFYFAAPDHVGKTVFLALDTFNTDGNGFARIDDFELTVGALETDPFLLIDSGDFAFGDLVHSAPGASTTRLVTFRNIGASNNLTLDTTTLLSSGNGIFSISAAPASSTVIPPDGTFQVAITATGGGDFTAYSGEVSINTIPSDQAITLPISAKISTGREVFITGSTVLVDYDDELDNGIHDASIRNGGFEDGAANQTFVETPFWVTAFSPEGDNLIATLDTLPATGLLHGQTSGFTILDPADQRGQVTQVFDFEDWTIAAGDTLDIEFAAMAGANNDILNMQVIVEVMDANGAFVNDAVNGQGGVTNRWGSETKTFVGDGSAYETFFHTTPPIQADSPWIGNRPRVRIIKQGLRTGFANIDNVSITGNFSRLSTNNGPFAITFLDVDIENQEVTLRFVDTGASTYIIQSDSDLNFDSGFSFTLDGSEDRTTYPGQIQVTFEDGNLIGDFFAWRVVAQ